MTRDRDREVIGRAGTGNRTHGLGRSYPLRDFHVRDCLAYWNFPQRLPHTALEGRASHVERQIQSDLGKFNKSDDSSD